jgi:UDP-galactopyranose mutase
MKCAPAWSEKSAAARTLRRHEAATHVAFDTRARIGTMRNMGERLPLFRSFWMTGFDGADHMSVAGPPQDAKRPPRGSAAVQPQARWEHISHVAALDAADASQYRRRVEADYHAVRDAGIACVRESIDWRRVSRGDRFDFSTVAVRAECARRAGLQIAWTLCNGGAPDGIDMRSGAFVDRFAIFARAAARMIGQSKGVGAPVYMPVNEIAFQSWALAETGLFHEQRSELRNRGHELLRQLVRAALAACDAILEVVPQARFVHVEPIVSTRLSGSDARIGGDSQFEVWDMLSGRLEPELGGHPRYLDVVGVHHHHSIPSWRGAAPGGAIAADVSRFMLHQLLADIHARYGRPIVVCETNHESAARAAWLRELGDEIGEALLQGIPVQGACLCRAVARPTWEDPRYWRGRRLWDVLLQPADDAPRASDSAYGRALRDVQARIGPLLADRHRERAP